MHDAEETGLNSAFFDAMKMYTDNKVFTHFGVSWNEMKKLTHEEFTYIMELSARATKAENDKAVSTSRELANIGSMNK